MHRLGDIRPAVIDQDPTRRGDRLGAQPRIGGDLASPLRQGRIAEPEVDEARPGDLHASQARIARQARDDLGGHVARIAPGALGGGQGAVALEVGEVGPVGRRHAAEFGRQSRRGEGGTDRFAEAPFKIAHRGSAAPATVVWPALTRKRLPSRLNAAICGVTSKPTRISKLEPLVVAVARGMVIWPISSVA